jgi:hypothetical protein
MIPAVTRARDLLRRPGGRLIAAFVAIPFVLFGLPAMAGVTWLSGDNLIQNFPLRVLVGVDLRHLHAPVWDPYLWSGSPLLSAFNAGAAYPATWVFAVLPGAFAWVVNQAMVEVVAAIGMVVLLRVLGRSWTASGLGALAFAYGGFMVAQSVHIDVVEAAAWLPWAFAALDRLAHPAPGRSAAPWVAMLGASIGLMGLSGSAEPILDGGVVLALYALWLLWRTPQRRVTLLIGVAVGLGVGLAVASAQLVPGALVQSQSQRAAHDYTYFASGSMNKSLTLLGLDPLLLGTNHAFAVPYIGTYNLPEISSYIGILPVMGVFGLLARRHRRQREARRWWIWYGVLGVGLLLTWGGFTPLGHVFYYLPLFNRQRLLARNLLEVDLAAAVLFAVWVDHMFLAPSPEVGADRGAPSVVGGRARRWRRRRGAGAWGSDVVLPLLPVAAVLGLQIVLVAGGPWFVNLLHVPVKVSRSALLPLVALLCAPSAIAVGAAILVIRRVALARVMPRLLGAVMVIDLVLFNVFIQGGPDPSAATSAGATWANQLAALVGAQGQGGSGGKHRIAIFDPDGFDAIDTDHLGEADLNILRGLSSVQGYGAVVEARYDLATGTHRQLNVTPSALGDGTFAQLDLGVLASVPQYFAHMVVPPPGTALSRSNYASSVPPNPPEPSAPPETAPPPPTPSVAFSSAPPPTPTVTLAVGTANTEYLGAVLSVTSVAVPLAAGAGSAASVLRVGLLSADGRRTAWIGSAPTGHGPVVVRTRRPQPASGIVLALGGADVSGAPALQVRAPIVRTAGQGTYRLDGSLRDAVAPPRWRFVGTIGPFCMFTQAAAAGRAWVQGDPGAQVRVVSSTPWGDQTIQVRTARPAVLVRSEQFTTGWQATVTRRSTSQGPRRTYGVSVRRHGLIQQVSVPAGTSTVHFTYRPHRVLEGFVASVLGVIALGLLVSWPRLRARVQPRLRRLLRRGRRGAARHADVSQMARGGGFFRLWVRERASS